MGNFWCIGRSYADHALELGNKVPDSPLVFLKADSCMVPVGQNIVLPKTGHEIHHEVEMALLFSSPTEVDHYAVALDLTNRSLQNQLKEKGHPWTLAKSFSSSAPLGPWIKIDKKEDLDHMPIELLVNGEIRQKANTSFLIFSVASLIDYVAKNFPVKTGDILLTGTPSGVAAIKSGDKLEAKVGMSQAQWLVE